jgi:hypothetical protein
MKLNMIMKMMVSVLLLAGSCNLTQTGSDQYDWYVSASGGSDSNTGHMAKPFKTITKALSVASSPQVVKVLPGLYDTAAGEVFPLTIPSGVSLIGNESLKGTDTIIRGGADLGGTSACVRTGPGALIAGMSITNNLVPGSGQVYGIEITEANVTLRNCTILDCTYGPAIMGNAGVIFYSSGNNARITDCRFINNSRDGMAFSSAGGGTIVEGSEFRGNSIGLEIYTTGGDIDMGGGGTSMGGNTFACNTGNDVIAEFGTAAGTIDAQNDYWDHAPLSGNDFVNYDSKDVTVITTGAMVAANNCP